MHLLHYNVYNNQKSLWKILTYISCLFHSIIIQVVVNIILIVLNYNTLSKTYLYD